MATSACTLPARLLPLALDQFPQSLLPLDLDQVPQSLEPSCVCRAGQREPRLRCLQCGIIEEEEEDGTALEQDQALRSYRRVLENLRRSIC